MATGRLSTVDSFSFRYGRIEIHAILPSADWIFPQIFLEASTNFYGKSNYDSGQMRIAFTRGRTLSGGVLLNAQDPFRLAKMCNNTNEQRWSEAYHTYAMEWRPNRITVSVDETVYCTIDPGRGFHTVTDGNGQHVTPAKLWQSQGPMAPFDQDFYLTLGIGVGGFNDFPDQDGKPWRNYAIQAMRSFWNALKPTAWPEQKAGMDIDYVRVYAI